MTPERWEQISEIYHSALELDSGEQTAFLEKACAGDETLRREVESLLSADAVAGAFIAEPVVKDISSLLKTRETPVLTGQILGNYEILSQIGIGGMGEVYLARDTRLNRLVALKTLPASFAKHPNQMRRFEIEARAAAMLNHPNVATVYSVEEIGGQLFYTMEYVDGKTLDALIPSDGLDLKTFLEWFIDVSDALAHAHEKGIVHRDIKPGNIMIAAGGVPKILDFGLAQIDESQNNKNSSTFRITNPGQILGTPSYMSPEQAEGGKIDHCSDIFSLGVVMYEALTGVRPFQGGSYASIVSEILTKKPQPVNEIKPEIPFLLSRLVMRCLEKESRKRLGSMGEVRVILEEIQAALDADISTDSAPFSPLSKPKEPSRLWIFAPLTVVFVALILFAVFFSMRKESPPIHFGNMTLRKLSQTNNVVYAHITPDGKSVAYNTIEEGEKRAL